MKLTKLFLLFVVLSGMSAISSADEVFRIQIGKDYQGYTQSELQRRVWELERAVGQLQNRVFQLEAEKPVGAPWLCTISAMGDTYTGTADSRAVATANAINNCKAGRGGDGFFCKNPKCEQ